MKLYDETQTQYLETDASGIRLGAALLQTRSGTGSPTDKASDNNILRPIVLQARACHVQKKDTATLKDRH